MLYKEVDQNKNSFSYGFFGVLFILLSLGLLAYTGLIIFDSRSILGISVAQSSVKQDTTETKTTTTKDGPAQSDPKIREVQEDTVTKTSPTAVPVSKQEPQKQQPIDQPSEESRKILEQSTSEEVLVSSPETEIVIKNENNALVITTSSDDTQLVKVKDTSSKDSTAKTTTSDKTTSQDPSSGQPKQTTTTSTKPDGTKVTTTTSSTGKTTVITTDPQGNTHTEVIQSNDSQSITQDFDDGGSSDIISDATKDREIYEIQDRDSNSNDSGNPVEVVQNSLKDSFSFDDDESQSRTFPPTSAIKITYASGSKDIDLDRWLEDYQFQVWALGDSDIAIHRKGITTVTSYPIKLGLSKQSFKADTEAGEKQVLYYPDSVWTYATEVGSISEGTHDEPMKLVIENNELVYHIKAASKQFMFAVFPTEVCKEMVISAETRKITYEDTCSVVDTIKDAISIRVGV